MCDFAVPCILKHCVAGNCQTAQDAQGKEKELAMCFAAGECLANGLLAGRRILVPWCKSDFGPGLGATF